MDHQLQPTVTFILPVQNKQNLVIEQINSFFKFSEQYPGFCEIIIVTDNFEDKEVYLLWLALKLNKVNHPYVRTKMIRYATKLDVKELIETGIKNALGEKVIVVANNSERIKQFLLKDKNTLKDDVLVTSNPFNIDALKETLIKH
jgi:hypothetical protein